MARGIEGYWNDLRETKVWRSVFRSGAGSSTLHRALAVQQSVFLHLALRVLDDVFADMVPALPIPALASAS